MSERETRRYDSEKRRRQAEATRRKMAASALALFSRDGYGATTVETVAADAGVSPATFYAVFGAKRGVLLELLEELEEEAGLASLRHSLEGLASREQLRRVVAFNARLFGRAAPLLDVLRQAGSSEPDLEELWREGEARRRKDQAPVVEAWVGRRALRPGLAREEAADLLWAWTGPDAYRLLVTECGWDPDAWTERTTTALGVLLFGG